MVTTMLLFINGAELSEETEESITNEVVGAYKEWTY